MLDPAFVQRISSAFGQEGQQWLRRLPALLEACARRWSLDLQGPYSLSYNYVAPATGPGGRPLVLKVGVPRSELSREIAALQFYAGRGSVALVEADPDGGCMLLERVEPATRLVELADDAEATRIAAETMRQLWRPLPNQHPFKPVSQWSIGLARLRQRFDGGTGPLPADLVARAEGLFAELQSSARETVLIHGDLHHENILQSGQSEWLAIDPKGMAGEPAYDVGALLRNPLPQVASWADLEQIQARRVAQLNGILGIDRGRIAGYGVAQAVLSAWWTLEDHETVDDAALRCARSLLPLLAD